MEDDWVCLPLWVCTLPGTSRRLQPCREYKLAHTRVRIVPNYTHTKDTTVKLDTKTVCSAVLSVYSKGSR
jgi:hypothetical protein